MLVTWFSTPLGGGDRPRPAASRNLFFMDLVSVVERNFVLVIEAKRSSLGETMKQCLLSMKDMRDNNGGGKVYGFVTFGEIWRMISYVSDDREDGRNV